MQNEPLVSVIMPTLNCKEFLAATMDGVVMQTYKNFEFLIIDDLSSDGTRELISEYSAKDSRIKLVDGEMNGIGGALNKGCCLAKGEYIARIDADDICLPTRFAEEVAYLNCHDDVVLVNSDYYAIDEGGKIVGRNYPCSAMSVIKRLLQLNMNPIAHPTCMFRKDIYAKTPGYPLTPSHEDLILWKSMVKYGTIGVIKHPLIYHRLMGVTLSRKFIGNPYEQVLNSIIDKIIYDGGRNVKDIEIYKTVMKMASSLSKESKYETERSQGEFLYRIFGKFLPNKISQELIILIKNIYLFFHYSCWKQI